MRDSARSWLLRVGLFEAAVLVTLLLVAGGIWGFAELADEVTEGDSRIFDESVLGSFRRDDNPSIPLGPIWLKGVVQDLTALGGVAIITLVCSITVGFLALRRRWGSAFLVLVSIAGGAIVSSLLKSWFDRPRPQIVPHLAEVSSMSFPSGHSMLSAITYLTLGTLLARTTSNRRVKYYCLGVAVLLTLIVGTTRVYLGVHYPTDVLAGWCAGISWALLCDLTARWLQNRGTVEAETPENSVA